MIQFGTNLRYVLKMADREYWGPCLDKSFGNEERFVESSSLFITMKRTSLVVLVFYKESLYDTHLSKVQEYTLGNIHSQFFS